MCSTKSHLSQIDCSPLCQSQLSVQTTTLLCVCVRIRVSVSGLIPFTFTPLTVCKVFIVHPATVLLKMLHSQLSKVSDSGYQVCQPAPGHVQSHHWPSPLHLLNWSHLVRERKTRNIIIELASSEKLIVSKET